MDHKQSERVVHTLVMSGELEIDADGRVWRVKKRTFNRWTGETRVTPCRRVRAELAVPEGGLQVRAMIDGRRYHAAAGRLVWHHVNGPIPQGQTVRHQDGNKARNVPGNLRLGSYQELRNHVVRVLGAGHHDVKGSKHPKTTLTEADVVEIRRLRSAGSMVKAIAEQFNISQNAASQICRNVTWKHVPSCSPG